MTPEETKAAMKQQRDALLEACKALLMHIAMEASDRISANDSALVQARAAIAAQDNQSRRCMKKEGSSDGDTYAGCVLAEGHDGECNVRSRPEDKFPARDRLPDSTKKVEPCETCGGRGRVPRDGKLGPEIGRMISGWITCPDCTEKKEM